MAGKGGFLRVDFSGRSVDQGRSVPGKMGIGGVPPSPRTIRIISLAGNCEKILELEQLTGKIFQNNDLAARILGGLLSDTNMTVSAQAVKTTGVSIGREPRAEGVPFPELVPPIFANSSPRLTFPDLIVKNAF
jgi:hypothetical protein